MIPEKTNQKNKNFVNDTIEKKNTEFIINIHLWNNRLKIDKKFVIFAFLMFYFIQLIIFTYILGFDKLIDNITSGYYLTDIMVVIIFLFVTYIPNKFPTAFLKIINNNRNIFITKEKYEEYINKVSRLFNSKLELILPVIFGLVYSLVFLFPSIKSNFNYYEFWGTIVYVSGVNQILLIIQTIIATILFFVLIILATTSLLLLLFIFKSLNSLGTKQFHLNVSYKDLKIGAFQNIGKFLISLIIPPILLCTSFSIYGLFVIFALKNFLFGMSYTSLGLILVSILSIILYKNTIHIHEAIIDYKNKLKLKVMNDIQTCFDQEKPNYSEIQILHNFYKEILDISDWPFDPTSIKKLIITLSSTIIPFALSFFGIGI